MIEMNNVSKSFGTNKALQSVYLYLPQGSMIGLVGENGSGKSTTLKLLAGLLQPTQGVVKVNGEKVTRRSAAHVSYLSESEQMYDCFTVEQYIAFYASQFSDFHTLKAEDMIDFMGMSRKQKVKQLSKGQRGRLKIILALSRESPLVLMDEPLSGLDPMVRDSIIKSLISFIDFEKQTVFMSTHEVSEVESLLDTVVAIKRGKTMATFDVEKLRQIEGKSVVEWMNKNYG